MIAGKEDILARQCQEAFSGTLGIRPGGPSGHAKTPEEDGMATFMYDGVIGSEQSLEVKDFFASFAGILTGSSSLLRNL